MFDTYITVMGTALNTPEKKLTKNNVVVANFRVATHARRFDKNTGEWVDAPSLRIRVACWRRLAEHVAGSVFSGDALVVHGRIITQDWVNEQGEPRISYTLEAMTVGHDLNRGTSTFTRARAEPAGLVVEEEPDLDGAVPFDDYPAVDSPSDDDALALLAEAGLSVSEVGLSTGSGEEDSDEDDEASALSGGRRRRSRQPVPA
jgi:single-strand DNA-binding protein